MRRAPILLALGLALCCASAASAARLLTETPSSLTCPLYAQRTMDSCRLTYKTDYGDCASGPGMQPGTPRRSWSVLVQGLSPPNPSFNGFPGALGSGNCDCDGAYTQGRFKDIYACVGCKVCDKLQELNGQYGYSCTMAGGCVAPYPDTTKGYYVSCGANGPNVLPGHVAVPGQVWAAIKDIRCAPVS